LTAAFQRRSVAGQDASGEDRDEQGHGKLDRQFASAHATLLQRGYVQFHPVLAELAGGFKPALMLGHALYWTRHWLQRHPEREGWFWKTAAEWRDATALTAREQESARERLRGGGYWQERRAGAPARLHFRVDLPSLAASISMNEPSGPPPPPHAARSDTLAVLLGVPIAYFRPLADIAGGPAAGLVMSHLISLHRTALQRSTLQEGGYFTINVEEVRKALAISTKVLRNARDALKRAGFVQDAWTSERPPRVMVRVNLAAILACLAGQSHIALKRRGDRGDRVREEGDGPNRTGDRAHVIETDGNVTRVVRLLVGSPSHRGGRSTSAARVAHSSKLDRTDARAGGPLVESRLALLPGLYSKRNSSNTPTTPACEGERAAAATPSRSRPFRPEGDESAAPRQSDCHGTTPDAAEPLILPAGLDDALHEGARRIVLRAPSYLRQPLLDELAGHMASRHKVIENPLGWLHSVTAKAVNGEAVLTVAATVAATRDGRARYDAALAQAGKAPPHDPADRTPPGTTSPEEVALARARLAELRNELLGRTAARAPIDSTSDATRRDLALSQPATTHDGCALSRDGTPTDSTAKGSRHAAHEG
jgi:hypothetical protein